MKIPRVKLVWGGSRVIRGRWYLGLFGIYDRVAGQPGGGVAVSIRGALLWSAALLMAAYVAGATALFWYWQRNPYSILTYSDAVLYPFRRSAIDAKKGQAFIAQGTDLFRARKYADAATLLRLGLARYPRDIAGRLLLAQFYVIANQRTIAAATLEEGLTKDYPGRAYLEALFNAAAQGEDYARVVEIGMRFLPQLQAPEQTRDYRWLTGRVFGALLASGRNAEALEFARQERPSDAAWEHQVLAELALEKPGEALATLERWRAMPGADERTLLRLKVRVLREAKRLPEMERALGELRGMFPGDPAPLVYGIVQRAMAGSRAEADAALKDYIFRFGASAQNLILAAEPLAEIGQLELLRQCADAGAERGLATGRINVLLVQLLLERGDWRAAQGIFAKIPTPAGRDAAAAQIWRDWMERMIEASASPTEAAQVALLEFFRSRPWPLAMFRRTIEVMRRVERLETARDLLAVAHRNFPASAWAQEQGAKVAAELAARETPAVAAAPAVTGPRLPAEAIFFSQLNDALAARKWDDAAQLVRDARAARPAPSWVATREPALLLAQVRINHGKADRQAMMTATRLFLNGDQNRARQMLDVAEQMHREGDKDTAVLLAKEVVANIANFPPATRLLAVWEPKPAAAAPPATKK
jgi:hypothetical protein